jgi:hypothetical protein
VSDVGAEQHLELRAEGQGVAIEGEGVDRVDGLAAEVEGRGEETQDVFGAFDAAVAEFVEGGRVVARQGEQVRRRDELVGAAAKTLRRKAIEELAQLVVVDAVRVERASRRSSAGPASGPPSTISRSPTSTRTMWWPVVSQSSSTTVART